MATADRVKLIDSIEPQETILLETLSPSKAVHIDDEDTIKVASEDEIKVAETEKEKEKEKEETVNGKKVEKKDPMAELASRFKTKDPAEIILDDSKETDLENAMDEGRVELVKQLLEGGAPVITCIYKYETDELETPLTFAANVDRWDIFCLVLARANYEKVDDEDLYINTALLRACNKNSVLIVKLLLKRDLDITNVQDDNYYSALEKKEEARDKKDNKHTYADEKATYLHFCAFHGSREVLNELLKLGKLNIDAQDSKGNTPLHYASKNGFSTCVSLLLQKGAKIDIPNNDKRIALSLAIRNAPEELIYTLLRYGSDPNHEDRRSWTPLFVAAADGRDTIIPVLVNNGGNVDARNKIYQTPLMAACKAGNSATIKELLLSGASLDARDRNRSNAFTIARDKKQDEALSEIIRYYKDSPEFISLGWHEVLTNELYRSLIAMLDALIDADVEKNKVEINFLPLEIDRQNITPKNDEYSSEDRRKPFLLQRIANSGNQDLASHGVIRILVNQKFKRFGNLFLWTKTLLFSAFLLAMLYALVTAATFHRSVWTLYNTNTNTTNAPAQPFNNWDYFRFICEIFVVLFWLSNIFTESAEFIQVVFYARKELEDREEKIQSKLKEEEDRKIRKTEDDKKTEEKRLATVREKAEAITLDESEDKDKEDTPNVSKKSSVSSSLGIGINGNVDDKDSQKNIQVDIPSKTKTGLDDKSDTDSETSEKSKASDEKEKRDKPKDLKTGDDDDDDDDSTSDTSDKKLKAATGQDSDVDDDKNKDKSDDDKDDDDKADDDKADDAKSDDDKSDDDKSNDDDKDDADKDDDDDDDTSDDSDDYDDYWGYDSDSDYDDDYDSDEDEEERKKKREEQKKKAEEEKQKQEDAQEEGIVADRKKSRAAKLKDKIFGSLIVTVFLEYFKDAYNWLDILGMVLIFIVLIYRLINLFDRSAQTMYTEFQWFFAALAFCVNSIRLIKLLNVFPVIGTYMRIIILILLKDVPKFVFIFTLILIFFTVTLFVSFRVPIIVSESENETRFPDNLNDLEPLQDDGLTNFPFLLLYGIQVLLEGNALGFNFYYNSFNVLTAILYFLFLFLVIVVYLNIFIAQLSDTYADQKANALKIVAQYRLEFIMQVQTTSIFSLLFDFRKKFFDSKAILEDEEWLDYFEIDSIVQLAENFKSQESSETLLSKLTKLQHQTKVSSRTSEIIQSTIEKKVTAQEAQISEIKKDITTIVKTKLESLEKSNKEILEKLREIAEKLH